MWWITSLLTLGRMSSLAPAKDLKEIQFELGSFAGGINNRDAINSLQLSELRRAENAVLDERGGAAKRLGCQSQGFIENLIPNSGFEVDTTGWVSSPVYFLNAGGVLTRDATQSKYGSACAKVVTTNATTQQGMDFATIPVTAGKTYVAEVWIKGNVGGEPLRLSLGGTVGTADLDVTPTTSWQRYRVTLLATGTGNAQIAVYTRSATACTFFVDDAEVADTSVRILSLYTFYRALTQPQLLAHTNTGKILYTNDPSVVPIVWTQIATGWSTTVPVSFETFNSKVYMGDGISAYSSWDGAAYTTFPSAPKGRYLRVWKDTMWVSGLTGTPDRVYSSDPGNAEVFGVSSWIDMGKGDGDQSIALATDGVFLIYSKRERVFVMYDPVTFANRIADPEKGSESHNSWIHFDAQLYFLSRRGVCQWRGDAPAIPLSLKIDPTFQSNVLNLNALTNSFAYAIGNRIGWTVPEIGNIVPTMQIEYYPRLAGKGGLPGPFMFQRAPAHVAARVRWGSTEILYAGHNSQGKILWVHAPIGTDDGVTFQAVVETGMFALNAVGLSKYIRRMRFLGRGKFQAQILRDFGSSAYTTYTIDLSVGGDFWALTDFWGVSTWGPPAVIREKLINTDVYCKYVAFRFIDAETTIGSLPLPIGSVDYNTQAGEWAIYGVSVDGAILGVRE